MKFCKNLQHITGLADPEWAPFWVNYKMLKKSLHEFSSFSMKMHPKLIFSGSKKYSTQQTESKIRPSVSAHSVSSQCSGDSTCEEGRAPVSSTAVTDKSKRTTSGNGENCVSNKLGPLIQSPKETAFFKALHAEFRKASYFFGKTQEEFAIREARIRQGIGIIVEGETALLPQMWSHLSKSVRRLHRDLLLLETYAIMSFCAFSKILKKHDKVTGRSTRGAFMDSIVSKADFVNYPRLRKLIHSVKEMRESIIMPRLEGMPDLQRLDRDEIIFLDAINHLRKEMMTWRINMEEQQQPLQRNAVDPAGVRRKRNDSCISLPDEDCALRKNPPATVPDVQYCDSLLSSSTGDSMSKRVRTR